MAGPIRDEADLNLVKKLATGNLGFAIDLYRLTSARDNENVFFSPASINIALAMTRVGAKSETLKQLTKALNLHLVDKEEDIHSAYNLLSQTLNSENDQYTLRTANRMYVQESFELLKEFTEALDRTFKTEVGIVDFVKNALKSAQEINQWVEGVTNQKIRNLIQPAMLTPDTKLVLVNAIYFKGSWMKKFEESATKPMDFQVSAKRDVKIDMMIQKDNFYYTESSQLDCKVLQLHYSYQSGLSMLIFLPNQKEGLDQLTARLTTDSFDQIVSSLISEKVTVKLPKFKLETNYELIDLLKGLGIFSLFSKEDSDLSGINGKKELFVSKVIHKTFLDVNEKGTEAAAATAMMMMVGCCFNPIPKPEYEFTADHPFLFVIRDNQTGLVIFIGCLRNPLSSE